MPPNRIPRPSSAKGQRRRPADGEGEGIHGLWLFFYTHTNICRYNQELKRKSTGCLKYNPKELSLKSDNPYRINKNCLPDLHLANGMCIASLVTNNFKSFIQQVSLQYDLFC